MKNKNNENKKPEINNLSMVNFYQSISENEVKKDIWEKLKIIARQSDLSNDYIKVIRNFIPILLFFIFSSCGTVMYINKPLDECQKIKTEKRKINYWVMAGDIIIFPPFIAVDFLTKKIYKPCKEK